MAIYFANHYPLHSGRDISARRSRIANYGNLTLDRHQCRIFFHISDAEFQHGGFGAWPSTSQKLSGMMTHVSRSFHNWKNIKSEENNANLVTHPSWKFVFLWEFSRLCYKFDHLQSSYRVSISTWWGLIIRAHDFKLVGHFCGSRKIYPCSKRHDFETNHCLPSPGWKVKQATLIQHIRVSLRNYISLELKIKSKCEISIWKK